MFITLEGIDGSGKSSQLKFISSILDSHNINHIVTREPGGTHLGEQVRSVFLSEIEKFTPESELLLIFAQRFEHYRKIIKPSLDSKKTVLCDRFSDSTYAYQGIHISENLISTIETSLNLNIIPDLTILFDIPPEIARQRLYGRSFDKFDKKSLDFHEKVRQNYFSRMKNDSNRFLLIDASKNINDVQTQLHLGLTKYLNSEILTKITNNYSC